MMKTALIRYKIQHYLMILAFPAFLLFIGSCAQKASFMQSSVVPAAEGKVKIKQDNNQNYKIDVDITNLAEVEKVYSKNYSYVVWMETDEGRIEKLGQLVSSDGLFSKKLKASLETVSSYEPAKVFVTAERNENTLNPGNRVVLRTRNF